MVRERWQYPSRIEPVLDEAQRPEATTLDKWYVQHHNPTPKPPAFYNYPWVDYHLRLGMPETTSLDRWWTQPSEPLRTPPRSDAALYASTELVLTETQRPETVYADKWWQQASEPQRWPPPPWLEAATELVLDESQRLEVISLDKWWVQYHNPTPSVPPRLWEPIDLPWDETLWPLMLDKWWIQYHNPILPLPRIQGYIVLLEFAVPPLPPVPVPVVFRFQECQALWEIIHPSSWESAVEPSGYIA